MKNKLSLLTVIFVATMLFYTEMTSGCKCEHAKDYQIVKEAKIKDIAPNRSFGHWYIAVSADTHVEFAHTAIQAVMDLYDEYGADLSYVSIVPTEKLIHLSDYGFAAFAADSLGGLGLSGADQNVRWDWRVFVAHRQITQQQIDIAELWVAKSKEFPSNRMVSSCLVDTESLRQYIAQELNINFEDAVLPTIPKNWYRF